MNTSSPNQYITQTGRTILEQEARAIQQIAERLDSSFSEAVMLLVACKGKIIISGMGKSGIIAQKIAATMSSTGSTALFLHPADAAHGDLGIVSQDDVRSGQRQRALGQHRWRPRLQEWPSGGRLDGSHAGAIQQWRKGAIGADHQGR